ncbi:hypothetical protein, partial [Salmonella sp. s55004]|uniref:hypothetical protein n=1 Tax=Salmonella sp. s55004 TaxID=3159675 RepID=UPI00397EFB95
MQSDNSRTTDNAKVETVSVSSDNDDDDDDISQDAQLTEEILQYYETHVQMDHHYMQKEELKHRLECVIREIYPG